MKKEIKALEQLGATGEISIDELSMESQALFESNDLEALKQKLNARQDIVCAILPSEDEPKPQDEPKPDEDPQPQPEPDKSPDEKQAKIAS